ncbi:hypothetical protein [Elioraea sp.]|uniref:hypothetical protein n=1 Tax=Elioraea sp. TaxID=2185103 RepID=UPI003F723989
MTGSTEPHESEPQWSAEGAFVTQLARRATPERRPTGKARLFIAITWMLALVCGGAAAAMVVIWMLAPPLRLLVLDTGLALGLGTRVEDVQVVGLGCGRQAVGGGRFRTVQTVCDVTVLRDGARLRLEVHGAGAITRDQIRGFRTLGGALGAVWSPGVLFGRWLNTAPILIGLALTGGIAVAAVSSLPRQHRHLRVLRDGVPRAVDLLRHRLIGPPGRARLWGDIAFDLHGGRCRLACAVDGTPLMLDGLVTRGIALVTPGGAAEPLLVGGAPLVFPEEERAWIAAEAHALATVYRPSAPYLAALAGSLPPGPERDYIAGYSALWHATDPAVVLAAQARRDAAAAQLDPARIDALLQQCRAAVAAR